jgi:hypothetical protein
VARLAHPSARAARRALRALLGLGLALGAATAGAAERPEPRPTTTVGPALASASAGAWAGWTLGVDAALGPAALTAPAGAALGAALDLWLRPADPGPAAGARTLALTAHGAYFGRQIGRVIVPFHLASADAMPAALSAAGDAAGLGLALGLPPRAGLRGADWLRITGGSAAGHLGGGALATAVGLDDQVGRQGRAGLQAGGALIGGGATAWAATAGVGASDPLAPLVVAGQAAWVGAFLPRALGFAPTPDLTQGGAAGGAALGWSLGALTPLGPADPQEAAAQVAWAVTATAVARGPVDLWGGARADPLATGLMLAGGAGGSALGAAVAPRYSAGGDGQALLLGGGQLLSAAQAGIWGVVADEVTAGAPEDRARRRLGAGLSAYGLTAAATLSAPLWTEIDRADALLVGSTTGWGGWLGAAGGLALGAPAGPHAAATGAGAALGMGAGLGLLAPRRPRSVERQLVVDGVGLIGAGVGAAVGGLPGQSWRAAAGGALMGSALGAGAALWRTRPGAPPLWPPRGRPRSEENASDDALDAPPPTGHRGGKLHLGRRASAWGWSVLPYDPPGRAQDGLQVQIEGRY